MDTVFDLYVARLGSLYPGLGTWEVFTQEPTGDDNSGSGRAIKRGMLPFGDLVCLHPKMSETRRSHRLATDFSIARILATDEPSSSSSSSSLSSSSSPSVSSSSLGFPRENRTRKSPLIPSCPCCPSPLVSTLGRNSFDPIAEDREEDRPAVGTSAVDNQVEVSRDGVRGGEDLPWLHCTRYRPPRLPKRSTASKTAKRRPGKHPRIPFTPFQLQILEDKYSKGAYLARRDVVQLSLILRLPQSRVKIWFQNRRARERRESLQSSNEIEKSDIDVVNNT